MNISLAQFQVAPGDLADNLRRGELLIAEAAHRGSELICFPEMWTTGFQWAENERLVSSQSSTLEAICELAAKYGIWITGSMLLPAPDGRPANTSVVIDASGQEVGSYRKTHLFGLIHEDKHMAAGDALTLVDTPWGLAGLAICYDIRFPEIFRSYALRGADFVFCPAAFPSLRLAHWKVLCRARAIENQMFFIGTNQVGTENYGADGDITYCGSSALIDPWGEVVLEAGDGEELLTATIDTSLTAATRKKMTVLQDRRPEVYDL